MLHITLSAVSKSVKELEQELGAQLLVRGRKGVQLTQAGEAFHKHAAQAMASFRMAMDEGQVTPQAPQLLRVGALPTAAGYMLAPVIAQMRQRFPQIQVQVLSGVYDFLVGKLRTHELDLIVGRLAAGDLVAYVPIISWVESDSMLLRTEAAAKSLTAGVRLEGVEHMVLDAHAEDLDEDRSMYQGDGDGDADDVEPVTHRAPEQVREDEDDCGNVLFGEEG